MIKNSLWIRGVSKFRFSLVATTWWATSKKSSCWLHLTWIKRVLTCASANLTSWQCLSPLIEYCICIINHRNTHIQLLRFCPCWLSFVGFYPPNSHLSSSLLISHRKNASCLFTSETVPLSSPTRWFIPKRDLFPKLNGGKKAKDCKSDIYHDVSASEVKTIQIQITEPYFLTQSDVH